MIPMSHPSELLLLLQVIMHSKFYTILSTQSIHEIHKTDRIEFYLWSSQSQIVRLKLGWVIHNHQGGLLRTPP